MQPQRNIKESLRSGEKVDQILEKALRSNTGSSFSPRKQLTPWQQTLLNYMLLLGFIAICGTIIFMDMSNIALFHQNTSAIITFKLFLLIALTVGYIKGRHSLTDFLFPKANKEVIKTIYKLAPELETTDHEELEIEWNKSSLTNYMFLAAFVIFLIIFLVAKPNFMNVTFGLLEGNGIAATMFKVILIGLGMGIYLALRNLIVISKEYNNLYEMIWKVRRLDGRMKRREKTSINFIMPMNTKSLVGEKLKAIIQILRLKDEFEIQDLHDRSFIHHSIKESLPKYLTAAMPVLGLIGTLFGLSVAISGLEGVLGTTMEDRDVFVQHLGQALSGIGTAFYTTLEGSISMLILKYFNMVTSNARLNFLTDLETALAVEVLPRIMNKNQYILFDEEEIAEFESEQEKIKIKKEEQQKAKSQQTSANHLRFVDAKKQSPTSTTPSNQKSPKETTTDPKKQNTPQRISRHDHQHNEKPNTEDQKANTPETPPKSPESKNTENNSPSPETESKKQK